MTALTIVEHHDGFYDDSGHWQRTKFCAVDCGDRCTCKPPFGLYRLTPVSSSGPEGRAEGAPTAARDGDHNQGSDK